MTEADYPKVYIGFEEQVIEKSVFQHHIPSIAEVPISSFYVYQGSSFTTTLYVAFDDLRITVD